LRSQTFEEELWYAPLSSGRAVLGRISVSENRRNGSRDAPASVSHVFDSINAPLRALNGSAVQSSFRKPFATEFQQSSPPFQ
jgi:hypothetical protein